MASGKNIARVLGASLFAVVAASPAWSQAPGTWRTHSEAGRIEAHMVRGTARGWLLRLSCPEGKAVWLNYHLARGWNGAGTVVITIDGVAFPMGIDGSHEGAILSNAPNNALGVTRAFLDRLKEGRRLVISGTATTRVPAPLRTFSLAGAAGPVAAVERGCPGLN
jgi:hypothetical protein